MPQGLVKNNPANDPDKKPVKARSHFKPNVSVYQTVRFGEASPFYGAAAVPDDEGFSIRVNSDVDTLTLKSPLMAPVRMNKDYFFAPIRSILPKNADRFVTNPLTGDDVIPKDVNCVIRPTDVVRFIRGFNPNAPTQHHITDALRLVSSGTFLTSASIEHQVSWLIGLFFTFYRRSWLWLSEGSLLRNLGYNFHQLFNGPRKDSNMEPLTYDQFCEEYFAWFRKYVDNFSCTLSFGDNGNGIARGQQFKVYCGSVPQNDENSNVGLREFVYLLQQGAVLLSLSSVVLSDEGTALGTDLMPFNPWSADGLDASVFNTWLVQVYSSPNKDSAATDAQVRYVNLNRAIAYQLACVQFYTSDAVDYVYSPELWHENMMALLMYSSSSNLPTVPTYRYNGIVVQYDSVSGKPMADFITNSASNERRIFDLSSTTDSHFTRRNGGTSATAFYSIACEFYFSNLLGFNRSLKFRDYFVGSKIAPMAVGNVNVAVTSGEFSVVDVTKNILRQRFLNQVNRVGRTLKEYSQGIFGSTPMRDPHEVVLLGGTSDIIGAEETQNTGSEQRDRFSMTSRLRTESSKFAFEGTFSEFGVVVGILTFDVARPYVNNCDRENFHVDRFDMFNPFMQNIGDQMVYGEELDIHQNDIPFGYQLRYMEYRQRVDYAAGGFHKFLPGYAFLADSRNIKQPGEIYTLIGPDFIRSRSFEFDALYEALPYFSPAGYFHFIIRHDIEANIDRPMLSAPSIL